MRARIQPHTTIFGCASLCVLGALRWVLAELSWAAGAAWCRVLVTNAEVEGVVVIDAVTMPEDVLRVDAEAGFDESGGWSGMSGMSGCFNRWRRWAGAGTDRCGWRATR